MALEEEQRLEALNTCTTHAEVILEYEKTV